RRRFPRGAGGQRLPDGPGGRCAARHDPAAEPDHGDRRGPVRPRMGTPTLRRFIAHVEDRPGVLDRIASPFRRRGHNIESLTVGRTHTPGVSRVSLVLYADEDAAHRIEATLYKLVNTLRVQDVTDTPCVERDLGLIKVKASPANRAEVLKLCEVF